MVKVPCADVGPVTRLAVKATPMVFASFDKTDPETGTFGHVLL